MKNPCVFDACLESPPCRRCALAVRLDELGEGLDDEELDDELDEELDDGLDKDLRDACVACPPIFVVRVACAPGVAALYSLFLHAFF